MTRNLPRPCFPQMKPSSTSPGKSQGGKDGRTQTELAELCLFEEMNEDILGGDAVVETPFGTAAWKLCMTLSVIPLYANTHSETSMTAVHVNTLRSQVVFIVDSSSHHTVILPFREMAQNSNLIRPAQQSSHSPSVHTQHGNLPPFLSGAPCPSEYTPGNNKGCTSGEALQLFFHVIEVKSDTRTGTLSLRSLLEALRQCWKLQADRQTEEVIPLVFVTAVSNVTGMENNVPLLCRLVHAFGGAVLFDFAAAAGHVRPDMNPSDFEVPSLHLKGSDTVTPSKASSLPQNSFMRWMVETRGGSPAIDVATFSPHKLLGGPGTPGVLLMKNFLLCNSKPGQPGGGSVSFVGPEGHSYIGDTEEREEAGTPDILGSIRCGLLMNLHAKVGIDAIRRREQELANMLINAWASHPRVRLAGPSIQRLQMCKPPGCEGNSTKTIELTELDGDGDDKLGTFPSDDKESGWDPGRVGIISFQILSARGDERKYLHHNFVCAVLNDVFGVQIRSGCACAGPYLIQLLKMENVQEKVRQHIVKTGCNVFKPGVSRAGVHFTMTDEEAVILRDAVLWVADFGDEALGHYTFVPSSGRFLHQSAAVRLPPDQLYGKDFVHAPASVKKGKGTGTPRKQSKPFFYSYSKVDLAYSGAMEGIQLGSMTFEALQRQTNAYSLAEPGGQLVFAAKHRGETGRRTTRRLSDDRRAIASTPTDTEALFDAAFGFIRDVREGMEEDVRSAFAPLPVLPEGSADFCWFAFPDPDAEMPVDAKSLPPPMAKASPITQPAIIAGSPEGGSGSDEGGYSGAGVGGVDLGDEGERHEVRVGRSGGGWGGLFGSCCAATGTVQCVGKHPQCPALGSGSYELLLPTGGGPETERLSDSSIGVEEPDAGAEDDLILQITGEVAEGGGGSDRSFVLCRSKGGKVYAFGDNSVGQCGFDPKSCSRIDRPRQVRFPLSEPICQLVVVEAEGSRGAPVCYGLGSRQGRVFAWGGGLEGPGRGKSWTPVDLGLKDARGRPSRIDRIEKKTDCRTKTETSLCLHLVCSALRLLLPAKRQLKGLANFGVVLGECDDTCGLDPCCISSLQAEAARTQKAEAEQNKEQQEAGSSLESALRVPDILSDLSRLKRLALSLRAVWREMNDEIRHGGPYAGGVLQADPEALSWRRRDASRKNMPLISLDGDALIEDLEAAFRRLLVIWETIVAQVQREWGSVAVASTKSPLHFATSAAMGEAALSPASPLSRSRTPSPMQMDRGRDLSRSRTRNAKDRGGRGGGDGSGSRDRDRSLSRSKSRKQSVHDTQHTARTENKKMGQPVTTFAIARLLVEIFQDTLQLRMDKIEEQILYHRNIRKSVNDQKPIGDAQDDSTATLKASLMSALDCRIASAEEAKNALAGRDLDGGSPSRSSPSRGRFSPVSPSRTPVSAASAAAVAKCASVWVGMQEVEDVHHQLQNVSLESAILTFRRECDIHAYANTSPLWGDDPGGS
uniref:Aminotransferase class V domain-containing protein n=1 Tax=Chromera velia CCMP2878 TaxID=1169474 RepID=A0A0G4I7K8_9ALVE|eukprot:Cvel_1941.t1-p1 / transcript=Cvel_1941.t1 / gene=Cvel_1941 / organism=Chromera_velia_CCMP2878 / gene_product=hypothetical protein / transcript_product=hypothetical protein / location=Cvel_scaffold73:47063-65535(-) / protein_length=1472 / sequence_SO=supercontig / SO=protein_coding / is_pseudo=false